MCYQPVELRILKSSRRPTTDQITGKYIHSEAAEFLNLRQLPITINILQVTALLNRSEDQIRALIAGNLLKPLGNPERNSVKMFATSEILKLGTDLDWQQKVQRFIGRHHANKALKQSAAETKSMN